MIAGHDTTAHTLTYMMWEIVQNPGLQDALAVEARQELKSRTDFPSKSSLSNLGLLDRVWQESLRKHPAVATGTVRVLNRTVTLPTSTGADCFDLGAFTVSTLLEIPANALITIPPFSGLHMHIYRIMYTRICRRMYVYLYVCLLLVDIQYSKMNIYIYIHIYFCIYSLYIFIYTSIRILRCKCLYIYPYLVYMCLCVYMLAYMYNHARTHKHYSP